ncbi:MAG: hypothetical protein Q7T82_02005 [Armatimonadota bacterium]|nr:hypothetical protein [Armatimonadota bacterium]
MSKKEADNWVSRGTIRAELSGDGRRRIYDFDSLMEGNIAKQVADFASRELLQHMMEGFQKFVDREKLNLDEIPPIGERRLVKLYTRKSKERVPGGGVRGVVPYVSWFDPSQMNTVHKGVFLVVDLTEMALEVKTALLHFSD